MKEKLSRLDWTDVFLWLIGASIVALVVIGSIATLADNKYTSRQWFDFFIFGIAQGSVYALIALGYTLVYGILRMINFAHSEVYMSGAFSGYFIATGLARSGFLDSNPILGLVMVFAVAMTVSTVIAILLERIAYRPLRRAPRLVPLITAIGASFFLQYTFRGLFGSQNRAYPEMSIFDTSWTIAGGLVINPVQVLVIVAASILMIGLYLFVQYTRTGKAMRAVSEDKDVAALMGIDVDGIIVRTFALGAALAGAAGVLYALMFRQVSFFMGFVPGIKAFTAAVLGGIGNIPGAMLGGVFLGIFESVGPTLFLEGLNIPAAHQLKDVIAFTLLVLILIFRPTGILGEKLTKAKA
ncbi:MAG: branched-chain amino acid ABC transporter permease [Anaerolineales bacterium]